MSFFQKNQSICRLLLVLGASGVAVAAPEVVVNAPPAGATNVGSAVTLDLGVSGATGTTAVAFYGRKTAPATPGPDFVLGTLPDTQYYSQNTGGTRAAIFHAQTQWYLDNRVAMNLAFISHMGDFVQTGDNSGNPVEWQVADGAMARIEHRVNTLSAYGIPWGGAPGNHDTSPNGSPTGTSTFFNQYFGETRFAGRDFYRGHYGTTNNNNYEFFSASGLDFIVIHLTYRTASITTGEQEALDWADALLKAYPNRRAIVTSHWILGTGNPAPFQGPGQRIYDNLKDNPNLFMLLCGHVHGTGRRTDVFSGNSVHAVLQDFQDDANGGDGWLRYFIFSPANNTISARTFSPTRNNGAGDSRTDSGNQFTLAYNQQGAVTGWIPLGTVNLSAGATSATLPWTGLETDSHYEWYVTATDSNGTTTTTARRFATVAAQPPVVTLGAPANGAVFTAPATVTLTATATDADGTVARVEFYQGTTKLGEDTTGPSYDLTWNNPPVGSHVLSAVAIDNTGRGTLSNVVGITVNPGAGGGSITYAENFNSMGASGTVAPAGWSIKNGPSGTSTSTWTSTIPGTGTNSVASMVNAAGALTASSAPTATNNNGYNAGAPGNATNRLLATSPTTNAGSAIQLQLTNSSSGSISQLLVGYDLQRFTAASSANELPGYRFFYSLDSGTTWTNVATLNPAISGSTGVVVPNTTGVTTVAPSLVTLGSPWGVGTTLLLRWVDDNAAQSSPDQVLGLDNVTVATPGGAAQPPTISDIANQAINEDTATAALAFTVGDLDTPVASLTVSGSSSNPALVPNSNLVFGGSGASRTVIATPLANLSGTATITVTVSDGSATATDTFLLTVSAVNDQPTISDIGNQTVSEDASTAALAFAVGDVETATGSLTVSGSSSNNALVPNANITFGGSGASRTVTVTPLANQSGTATITVTVSDGSATATDTFLLTVNAINDAPTISNVTDQSVNEDTGTAALPFTVGDVETAAGSLTVSGSSSNPSLVPVANIAFGGSGASRTVTVTPLANQSGTATITLSVSDGNATATDTFVVTVGAVNDVPTISDIGNQSINEDTATASLGFTVGDPETAAGSLVVSGSSSNPALVPNGNLIFSGSGASRTLTVTPAANQSGTATITVTVSDGTAAATDTFLLTVNAINDSPTISGIGSQTIVVNHATGAIGFTIGDLETPATDLTLTATSSSPALVPGNRITFGGNGANRTVTIDPATDQSGSALITINVSDGEASTEISFTLTVDATPNTPPTIDDIADQAVDEDTSTAAIPFAVGDAETPDASLIVSASSSNPSLVPDNNIVLGGSGANRTITVTPLANQSGTAIITVTVSDGTADATDTFLLTVSAVNDSPTISDLANQTINEDSATAALPFAVGDAEAAAGSLVVSGSSSNPALVPDTAIVFGGSGGNRTVTVTPLANQSGVATITVTVSDGSASATDTFLLTVGAVNDTPTISDVTDQSTSEDTGTAALPFVVGDVETAAGSLVVSGSSSNPALVPNGNLIFGGSGANRTVAVTPLANQSGTATITITVSDGNATATDTFVVTVGAVNDAPTIADIANLAVDEDTSMAALPFSVGDVETAAGSLTVTASSSNTLLVPNGNISLGGSGANRTIAVTPAANQNGAATITVTVSDGLASASDAFVLTVNAVNDLPTITGIGGQTTAADTPTAAINFTIGDLETLPTSLTLSGSSSNQTVVPDNRISFGGSGASRTVTINPATGQSGSALITVTVGDGTATASTSFTLVVNPAPVAPVVTTSSLPGGTVGAAYSALLAASGGTPPFDWAIASGSLPTGLTLSDTTGAITGTPTVAGSFNFTAAAFDSSDPIQFGSKALSIAVAAAAPVRIWSGNPVPPRADAGADSPVELGVKFRSDVAGTIRGIRFYKAAANTGTHIANLWSATGTLLATATFTGETASGWQQVNFSNPVAIAANTVYVASYHCNNGHFSADVNFFQTSGVDNAPLHALASGVSGPNGVFAYGAGSAFPNQTWSATNYWVDVDFQAGPAPILTSIAVTPTSPSIVVGSTQQFVATGTYMGGATQNLTNQVTWTSQNAACATINVAGLASGLSAGSTTISTTLSGVTGGTVLTVQSAPLSITTATLANGTINSPYSATLAATGGTLPHGWTVTSGSLPTGLALNGTTGAITGTPTVAGSFNFTVAAFDSSDPIQFGSKALSIAVAAAAPVRIWSGNPVPPRADAGADSPVELGVKFRSDVAGTIRGIRFYKAAANTGTHIANLWSATGTLLATATFTGETASGWQQVNFSNPVAIAANTVYVASYHCNNGHFSADVNFFQTSGVDNAPLHALASGVSGPNGVFAYGAGSAFPNQTWSATNYWVDVVFQP